MAHIDVSDYRCCIVCGHTIGRFSTICDKCGSIQRPAKGDGIALPPEEFGICEICGDEAAEGETLCVMCLSKQAPDPDVRKTPRSKKLKTSSMAFGITGFAFSVATIIIAAGPGGIGLIIGLAVPGGIFLITSGSLYLLSLTPKEKIEVYPRIPREG